MRRFTKLVAPLGLVVATCVTVVYLQWFSNSDRGATAIPAANLQSAAPVDRLAARVASTSGGRGERLVEQALATLNRRINVRASVRQETMLGGRRIQGTGAYWQQGAGDQRRTRWEVATQISREKASFLQIFDSDELWTDWQLPSSRDVSRVHLVRLRRDLSTSDLNPAPGPATMARFEILASGGLTALLAELVENFHFDAPTRGEISNQPALAVIGVWKPTALARISPAAQSGPWPAPVPHHVLLVLGQADLFPYLIEYRSDADASLADTDHGRASTASALSRFEMFDVEFAAQMDPELFHYTPPEHGARDATGEVWDQMRARLAAEATDDPQT